MPLSKAIQFSSLASQLTPSETISFIKDVADSNHQIIIDALSSYFLHAPPKAERITLNDQYVKSISTIIQSRDSLTEEKNEKSSITFDSLPRRLIGVCGSFLGQGSFRSLSEVNRAVYLGCNTPIVLTELEKHYETAVDHQLFNFSAFPFVKKLILKVDVDYDEDIVLPADRMNVIASQIAKMSQLQSLDLYEGSSEFMGIIANHEGANRRTKYLYVEQKESGHGALNRFLSAIASFKYVQFLQVFLVEDQDSAEMDIDLIIEMCSNLKGLDFDDSDLEIEMAVLQDIGHQLHYLKLYDRDEAAISALKDVNFANLRQLKQGANCSDDSFRSILKTAVNLEKVSISADPELISEILTQCQRLKYLEVNCAAAYTIKSVLNVMEQHFDKNKEPLQETLKIRIHSCVLSGSTRQQTKDISKIQRIINSLAASKVDQWMIILALYPMRIGGIKKFYKELGRTLNFTIDIARTVQVDEAFVITNPDCTINGIGENWLM